MVVPWSTNRVYGRIMVNHGATMVSPWWGKRNTSCMAPSRVPRYINPRNLCPLAHLIILDCSLFTWSINEKVVVPC